MTQRLVIRWTFGEWVDGAIHPQTYSMQAAGAMFARAIWPEAELVIVTSTVSEKSKQVLEGLTGVVPGLELVAAEPFMPEQIPEQRSRRTEPGQKVSTAFRNPWWKYAPFRLDIDAHEILADCDLVMWREPPSITRWRQRDDLWLCSGEELAPEDRYPGCAAVHGGYGNYRDVGATRPDLMFSTQMICWPPGMHVGEMPHPFLEARFRPHRYCTETGWLLQNWLWWDKPKGLIPWREVPLLTEVPNKGQPRYTPPWAVLTRDHCGGHWGSHTSGKQTHWATLYAEVATKQATEAMLDSAIKGGTFNRGRAARRVNTLLGDILELAPCS